MKTCLWISRLFAPLAIGFAFTASNGLATGIALGAAVGAALWVAKPKPC